MPESMATPSPHPESFHRHDIFMGCGTPGSHFIDVGGNFGYYSVMAAVYGCR